MLQKTWRVEIRINESYLALVPYDLAKVRHKYRILQNPIYRVLFIHICVLPAPPCHPLCQGFFPFLSCRIVLTKSLVRLVGMGEFVQGCFLELFFQSYLSEFVLLGLFGRICSVYLFDAKGCWQDGFGRSLSGGGFVWQGDFGKERWEECHDSVSFFCGV